MARNGKVRIAAGGALAVLAVVGWRLTGGGPSIEDKRTGLYKAIDAGNFKDAYEGLRKIALDPKNDPMKVGKDLTQAILCLQRLGRVDEIDAFREAVIDVHKDNWRLLATAARTFTDGEHYGYIVAGKFNRGHGRGQGRYVNAMQRDRTRALQLLDQALKLTAKEIDKDALSQYYLQFANALLNGPAQHEPWRLPHLTHLSQLPDYDEGYRGVRYGTNGAPVDDKGNPILYHLPKSYDVAFNDGQRWRWLLMSAAEVNPGLLNQV